MSLTSYQAAPPCNKGRANVLADIFPVNRLLRGLAEAGLAERGPGSAGPACTTSAGRERVDRYLRAGSVSSASLSEMVTLSGVMCRMRK